MQLRETQTVELKQSWSDEYLKTICAFANTNGGVFYIGVNDKGIVVDIKKNIKKWLESLPNKIMNNLLLSTSVEVEQYQEKDVIKITVPRSPIHSYQGKFYIRVGSTTQEVKGAELQRLLLDVNNLTWDEIGVNSATMDDIDEQTVADFVEMATAKNRLPKGINSKDIEKLFRNLNLITDEGKLTRAAILLFGKKPTHFFYSSILKIGRFRGDSLSDLIIHDQIEDNLFTMFEKALDLLRSKYLLSPISYEGMVRVETLEIPEKAIRETILNALIHKDYTVHSAISIKIRDARVIVWNSGELKLDVEKLKIEHNSFKRNPLLAEIFYRAGYIEAWGRGTNTIVSECVKSGLDEPVFSIQQNGLEVSFKRNPMRLADKGIDKPATEFSLRQQKIIDYVRENGSINNTICQELLNVSKPTATRELQKMVSEHILQQVGEKRGINYILTE